MTDHLFELSAGKDVKMAHNFKSSCENNAWKIQTSTWFEPNWPQQ